MPWWAWVAVAVPYLVCVRVAGGDLAHRMAATYPDQKGVPDGCDWMVGMLAGSAWPVLVLAVGLVRLLRLVCCGSRLPAIGAERAHRERHRRERVEQAERDLGIGQ